MCRSLTNTFRYIKGSNINVGNIPSKFFYRGAVFFQWKYNIEFWLFLSPLTHLYVIIEIL